MAGVFERTNEIAADITRQVPAADRENKDHIFGNEAAAAQAVGIGCFSAVVTDTRAQLEDVMTNWHIGLYSRSIPQMADGVERVRHSHSQGKEHGKVAGSSYLRMKRLPAVKGPCGGHITPNIRIRVCPSKS